MKAFKNLTLFSILICALFIVSGCSLFPAEIVASPPIDSEDPIRYVFAYDFADVALGDIPSSDDGVTFSGEIGDDGYGIIEVVADKELESGKALRIATNKLEGSSKAITFRFPSWTIPSGEVNTLVIEYKVKWVEGKEGIFSYFNKSGSDHRMILRPINGRLVWLKSLGEGTSQTFDLEPGWNQIRLVADKNTATGTLYINDMETPVSSSLLFQRPIESWEGIRIVLRHETNENEKREVLYGDYKVWILE